MVFLEVSIVLDQLERLEDGPFMVQCGTVGWHRDGVHLHSHACLELGIDVNQKITIFGHPRYTVWFDQDGRVPVQDDGRTANRLTG